MEVGEFVIKLLMYEDAHGHVSFHESPAKINLEQCAIACIHIQKLLEDLSFWDSIGEAMEEVRDACRPLRENQIAQHRRIERKVRMYLSEFSVFINHWEKKIKNTNTDNQNEILKMWEDLTRTAYDTNLSYMFIGHLRNYSIHGGTVVGRIHGSVNLPYVQPQCNRNYLLENYKKWKQIDKDFLHQQPDFFDLLPFLQESYLAIRKIHECMMDTQLTPQTISDCDNLMQLIQVCKELNNNAGHWDIVELFDEENNPLTKEQYLLSPMSICTRYYALWDTYPIIRNRAAALLDQ